MTCRGGPLGRPTFLYCSPSIVIASGSEMERGNPTLRGQSLINFYARINRLTPISWIASSTIGLLAMANNGIPLAHK
jgi:hypothetical protein